MIRSQCVHFAAVCLVTFLIQLQSNAARAATLWAAPQGTNTLITIDTSTGMVTGTFASPTTNNALTGLTLAEQGASLLYIDNSGGPLYRLDPYTAAVLSTSTLSFANTGGLSYQTNAGVDSIFLQVGTSGIVRQQGFGGSTTAPFSPIVTDSAGALGGDDKGRHFAATNSGGIQEFDPTDGHFSAPLFLSPGGHIAGLAFDGDLLYASSAATAALYVRDPDVNTGWTTIALTGISTPLVGLAMAPDPPANAPPSITAALLYDNTTSSFIDGNISVPEGTLSVLAKATVSDFDNDDVAVTIGILAAGTVVGGNGTTSPALQLSSPSTIDLSDQGVVPVTFAATDGTDDATQVTRNITVTNVAPTMDFLTASYNPTIVLIDDDVVLETGFSVPVGTQVTFSFKIDDPGLADIITASFDVGGNVFDFGPITGGTLADSFVYTFDSVGDFEINMSFSDGDGGDFILSSPFTITAEALPTPEPNSLVLLLLGSITGSTIVRRRRRFVIFRG